MWVFDGEEWTEEGATKTERSPETASLPMWDVTMPELQVVEHVPQTATRKYYDYVPPLPHP